MDNKEIAFERIAKSLLQDYTSVYYVDNQTDEYCYYSINQKYHSLRLASEGTDFYNQIIRDSGIVVHEDDREVIAEGFNKQRLLSELSNGEFKNIVYRLIIDGRELYHTSRIMRMENEVDDYLIIGLLNIDNEYRRRLESDAIEREHDIYDKISSTLSNHYDCLYFVNIENDQYIEFSCSADFASLNIPETGDHFFEETQKNTAQIAYPEDKDRAVLVYDKKNMLKKLEKHGSYAFPYRVVIDGEIRHLRSVSFMVDDGKHIIVCIENISEKVSKDEERERKYQSARKQAKRDELTGIRNKNAYQNFIYSIGKKIESEPEDYNFAIVICDMNDLKIINDTKGHSTGDEYIKIASEMVCDVFSHSPVFRIGGDEFAAILMGRDFDAREELIKKLRERSIENSKSETGPVVACGLASYDKKDKRFLDVFERADTRMYEDKAYLKSVKLKDGFDEMANKTVRITDVERSRLDRLFVALDAVSDEGYFYLCNMEYDYSRWSKKMLEDFDLPSEYIYHAKEYWEKNIHPDDLEDYRRMIEGIFFSDEKKMKISYRIRKSNGEYIRCITKGFAVADDVGGAKYFGGVVIPQE